MKQCGHETCSDGIRVDVGIETMAKDQAFFSAGIITLGARISKIQIRKKRMCPILLGFWKMFYISPLGSVSGKLFLLIVKPSFVVFYLRERLKVLDFLWMRKTRIFVI